MKTAATVICFVFVIAGIYFASFQTASLTPKGPGACDLAILGVTIPYNDAVRKSVSFLFYPLRSASPEIKKAAGTVVTLVNQPKDELALRLKGGTLIAIRVPSHLEASVSALKDNDQVTITYGSVPDLADMFIQRFMLKSLTVD